MSPDRWPRPVRVGVAGISGLLLLLSLAPPDLGWTAFLALVPLCLALRGASGRIGAACGLAFGIAYFGSMLEWIASFGVIAWVALVAAQAAIVAVFGWWAAWAGRLGMVGRLLGWPLLWVAVELARARWPLGGFAWGLLGTSQHGGGPALPVARLGGVFAVGVIVFAVNALVAEAVGAGVLRARAGLATGAIVLALAPWALPLGLAGRPTGPLDVAAVQGNVPPSQRGAPRIAGRTGPEDFAVVRNHLIMTEPLVGDAPDLVIWPENSMDRDPRRNPDLFQPVQDMVRRLGAPLIAGTILDDGPNFRNANIVIAPNGTIAQRYDKVHLVPFGEYVPWRWVRRLVPALDREIPEDGRPGPGPVVLHAGGAALSTVICFESTYPALVRDAVRGGGEAIVVTTNNASFGTSAAARQHLAQSQVRAVEHGRWVVHAAVSGVSAIIAPDGTIMERADLFVPATLRHTLARTSGTTPYTRYGGWIEAGLGMAGALVAVAAGRARTRTAMSARRHDPVVEPS